jgi:predicted ATP-dependent endonuclease of OLD family
MKLRHLLVRHFRGIDNLSWTLGGDFICLIGAGDSGKSTVLDAIELVLSPRWNLTVDDSDFYQCDVTSPIVIEATVGDLPRRSLSDSAFGLRLRGLAADGTLHDEPQDGDESVITIRLTVDESLEPRWEVVTDRHFSPD